MKFYDVSKSAQENIREVILDHRPENLPRTVMLGNTVEEENKTTVDIFSMDDVESFGQVMLRRNGKTTHLKNTSKNKEISSCNVRKLCCLTQITDS